MPLIDKVLPYVEILLHPLALVSLLVVCLGFCLFLFFHVMRKVEKNQRQRKNQVGDLHVVIQEMRSALEELKVGLAETQEQVSLVESPRVARNGFSLTTRSKALKLSRLGQTPQQIAKALEMPQGDVILLLKVHQMVMERLNESPMVENAAS